MFTVSSLVRKLKQQAREQMEERRPNLVSALNQMGDFYMELKWDFQSWGMCHFYFYGVLCGIIICHCCHIIIPEVRGFIPWPKSSLNVESMRDGGCAVIM